MAQSFTLKSGKVISYEDLPYCHLIFKIDNMHAADIYFGKGYDANPEEAPEWGCGNRIWEPHEQTELVQATLNRYNISKEDFDEICNFLSEKLNFGCCAYCA